MRARFFGIILRCLERRTPAPLVSLQLQILLNAAARAFGVPGKPSLWTRFCVWRDRFQDCTRKDRY